MRLARLALLILLAALIAPATVSTEPNTRDTRLLAQPATNGTHVAFVYADDLWVAKLDGTDVRRLTTDDGVESRPAFSPDGKLIAFSAQYDGNTDVLRRAGRGRRAEAADLAPRPRLRAGLHAWTGSSVLFTSGRAAFTGALPAPLHRARRGRRGGAVAHPERVPGDVLARRPAHRLQPAAAGVPTSGSSIAAARVSRLWLYNTADHAVEKVPQPADRANDVDPMWMGGTVYFRSDRDGEFNLYAYDTASKQVRRITKHDDFPVLKASAGGGKIVYEQAGWLHLLDPATGIGEAARRFPCRADLRETRARFVKGPDVHPQRRRISPSGARAVFEFRGEIVTVPAEKGDVRNLTSSPAAHERSPQWSPDGTRDRVLLGRVGRVPAARRPARRQGRREEVSSSTGAGFYADLRWSPDSQKIAFADNSQSVVLAGPGHAATMKRIGRQPGLQRRSIRSASDWSPDSKWLAYVVNTQPLVNTVFAYSTRPGQVVRRSPTA